MEGTTRPRVIASPQISVGDAQPEAVELRLAPEVAARLPRTLRDQLLPLGAILRVGTPTVWEATATAVVRQVVHRDQARAVFERVSVALGTPLLVGGQTRHAFPTAEQALSAGELELRGLGLGFKARTLMNLALWCSYTEVAPDDPDLYAALLTIKGIGPWSAAVAVCDLRCDFSRYPIEDLAVRAHAEALWPRRWPSTPSSFAAEWRAATAPDTAVVTAFLLARGAGLGR